MAKKTLKESGLAWRPFREMSHNATYIDSKTGEIVRTPSETSEVLVDAGTGQMIDPTQLFLDNEGDIGRTNTKNLNVILPYRYEYKLMPYHDTKRVYKVPVYNNDSSNNVTPEDAKRFGIKWEPELVGEDNWIDPSENVLNYGIAGGIAFPTLTSSLVAGELGGAGFNALYQATHNRHSMELDGISSMYNLGYWFGGDAGYKGYKYLANNIDKVYPWMLRTFGSKGSRLGHTMNLYMEVPTGTEFLPYNFGWNPRQTLSVRHAGDNMGTPYHILSELTDMLANYTDDFIPDELPPENYDEMLMRRYPAQGDLYTDVGGLSVATRDLDRYQRKYPEATNIEFGPLSSKFDWHRSSPTIVSDVPSQDLQGTIDYFNNIMQPLAQRRGYSLSLPLTTPKYYREIPYWETNGLGENFKILPEESTLAGWYNRNDQLPYINYALPQDRRLSAIGHEWAFHGTDTLLLPGDKKAYKDIARFLKENQQINISNPLSFNIPESENYQEVRATLNQVRDQALLEGKIVVNKSGDIDTSNLSDSDLLQILSRINGYGLDYVRMYNTLKPDKKKQWLRSVRRALEILPIAAIVLNNVSTK